MEDNFIYSVKELCDIFEINNNSFPSIARRLNINTSEYCKMKETYYKSKKRYYNKLAYKKLEEYVLEKNKKANYWTRKTVIYEYLKYIEEKDKEIKEYKKKIENKQEECTNINKTLNYRNMEIAKLKNELEKNSQILKNYKSDIEKKIKENKELKQEISNLKNKGP